MYLKTINLKGFKSFPDRTSLSFTPGVSVIVGPNGCGKSNITDAVLWALGEQRPNAIRGATMQDVIFSGGKGQNPRRFAEVEVVIDNSEGRANSEFSEIAITRRVDRSGDGEYRLNGARCRLADIVETLADTNLGREMHSVISQGRVESIVNSKPQDRRMLIEEAAGLGKHRKRRRRAQIKLDRTAENLERASDVEREARRQIRPLKAQAEAAERQAKLALQEDGMRATLVGSRLRTETDRLAAVDAVLGKARGRRDKLDAALAEVRERRTKIEERIAAGESERSERAEQLAEARAAAERIRARAEAMAAAERDLRAGLGERQLRLGELGGGGIEVDSEIHSRIAGLEQELKELAVADDAGVAELRAAAAEAESQRQAAAEKLPGAEETRDGAVEQKRRAEQALALARAEAEKTTARRERLAGELAAVEARLASAAIEGSEPVLAGMIEAAPGLEQALTAALGERLRATVVGSLADGRERISADPESAGHALIRRGGAEGTTAGDAPAEGARRLIDLVEVREQARGVAERLLAGVWLVDDLAELPEDFAGIAVTQNGHRYDGAVGEVRSLPRAGTDPALAARSQREELAMRLEERSRTAERAANELATAEEKVAEARKLADAAEEVLRSARRAVDEAAEQARRSSWLADQRSDEGPGGEQAVRRARIEAELASERRHLEGAERARRARARDRELLERRIALEHDTLPALSRAEEVLAKLAEQLQARAEALAAVPEEDGGGVAEELRSCSQKEFELAGEMRGAAEAVTTAEVEAAQLRDRCEEGATELAEISARLGGEPLGPAEKALADEERAELEQKLERLHRRREQIGPVNPLAEREYEEARERVTELSTQREDLESAIKELGALIRRTDREIATAFEETYEATAQNFEETVAELFPGGTGRLRRVESSDAAGSGESGGEGSGEEEPPEEEGEGPGPNDFGVEIEVTPAGKSMRKLSLLSGGEKSMVALAFVFAVLMARPCPFYILDEVEAALDDLNLDRFLKLVRRFCERSQFVIVTHQKRTMDAADILYGVSMGDDGITKVVSRKLPGQPDIGANGSEREPDDGAAAGPGPERSIRAA